MNTFQMGHCEGCLVLKTEKRILLKSIERYKEVVDNITNSESYTINNDLMTLSLEMKSILQKIKP